MGSRGSRHARQQQRSPPVSRDLKGRLDEALRQRRWDVVKVLLEDHDHSDVAEVCSWSQKEDIIVNAPPWAVNRVVPHCAGHELDSALSHLVARGLWKTVGLVLRRGVNHTQHRTAVEEASKLADEENFVEKILPLCDDKERDSVLTHLVARGLWFAVGKVLHRGVSETKCRWAAEEASKHADGYYFTYNILPYCADGQLDCVVRHLVTRRMWLDVDRVLQRGVSDAQRRWAVEESAKYAYCKNFVDNALPHCTIVERESVLTHLVARRLWETVGKVLERGVSDTRHRRTIVKASKHANEMDFVDHILPRCTKHDQLDSVLEHLVTRRLWNVVGKLLRQGVSKTQHRWTIEKASKHADEMDFINHILPQSTNDQLELALKHLVTRRLWNVVLKVLRQGVNEIQRIWAVTEVCRHSRDFSKLCSWPCCKNDYDDRFLLPVFLKLSLTWCSGYGVVHDIVGNTLLCWLSTSREQIEHDDTVFWAVFENCRVDVSHTIRLFKAVKQNTKDVIHKLRAQLKMKEELCEVLYMSVLHQLCVIMCSGVEIHTAQLPVHFMLKMNSLYMGIERCVLTDTNGYHDFSMGLKLCETASGSVQYTTNPVYFLYFLRHFSLLRVRRKKQRYILVVLFAVLPLFPQLQSVALRIMLRQNRWDVISQACLSQVWEQDRRHLFQAAVKQRQWSVVKQWADHTLYDDQRWWALEEAFQNKQWEVYLLLADHGLTDVERMLVHNRLARYGNWNNVLQMFERGGDVAEAKERLGRLKKERRTPANEKQNLDQRHRRLIKHEKLQRKQQQKGLKYMLSNSNWSVLLFSTVRNPSKIDISLALKAAIKRKAWHVVRQLVRLGMDTAQKNSLFSKMMKRQQWDVCRVLLEQGLNVEVCLKALPVLIEMNQWILVARVMEHDVNDSVRQQVMLRALERNEGSVVWLCITYLPTRLTEVERKTFFERAFSCELWQIIKPLAEEKDRIGLQHRDTALLEAIDQHQWDVVDHCDRHHADINMKDDEGHTPLQRAAINEDWEAVEELVVRDGNPNLLDSKCYSVLTRAIAAKQWDTVKLLIKYGADIHQPAQSAGDRMGKYRTPLELLIMGCQGEVLEHTLMWCPGQSRWVNQDRETALHAVCLSGRWHNLQHMVARMKNPLAMTSTGKSVLMYAALAEESPQRMVAECIRLGFAAHQPELTNVQRDMEQLIANAVLQQTELLVKKLTSPFLCAVLRGMPDVAKMLYESGSCSNRQLVMLSTLLLRLIDANTEEGRYLQDTSGGNIVRYSTLTGRIQLALPYLQKKVSTPRSLQSTCRLAVSRCLSVRRRPRHVERLPVPEMTKKYILFSDLMEQADSST